MMTTSHAIRLGTATVYATHRSAANVSQLAHTMRNTIKTLVASVAAALAMMAPMANASGHYYIVDAFSESQITLTLCSQYVDLSVEGDGDTDLDFWVYGPSGELVASDVDVADWTQMRLTNPYFGCVDYILIVRNLGAIYNEYLVNLWDL